MRTREDNFSIFPRAHYHSKFFALKSGMHCGKTQRRALIRNHRRQFIDDVFRANCNKLHAMQLDMPVIVINLIVLSDGIRCMRTWRSKINRTNDSFEG